MILKEAGNLSRFLLRRYIVFTAGVLINSFGISFITKANLGTSPISSVPYVLCLGFQPTFGQFSFALNSLFILAQAVLLRKDFPKIHLLLQLAVNFIFSWAIDLSMLSLGGFSPEGYVFRLLALAAGCAILAFGICLEVYANVLMVPGEGIVYAISKVTHKEFGSIKAAFDITLMLTATLLSLLFFKRLNGLGVGTVISAAAVGMIVRFFMRRLGFIGRFLHTS